MKLLIFIHSLDCGGAEHVISNLANVWVDRGWEIILVTMASRETDFYSLNPSVQRISLNLEKCNYNLVYGIVNNIQRIIALRKILVKFRPDIALGMMSGAIVYVAMSAIGLTSIHTVGSERTHPPMQSLNAYWEWMRCHTYGLLDTIVAQTQETATWLKNNTNASKVKVIPNAIIWPFPSHEPNLLPSAYCSSKAKLLLSVGRLSQEKRFGLLINVFSEIVKSRPDWLLVILGEGSERSKLESAICAAGLENKILLPGKVGNLTDWYQRSNCFVMSSLYEGFPNTLLEAMAHGLPVVSFDCDTGPRDIIRHEVDGLLVPAGDRQAFQAALVRLLDDENLRIRFGERAVEVRDRFSMEKVAKMWENLFVEIME